MAAKFILSGLALAGTAFAQQCSDDSITINSSADVQAIASCRPFEGNVIISSDASGQIDLGTLSSIRGDLTAKNASQLTSISGSYLAEIGGSMDLEELQIMSTLQFNVLTRVNNVRWIALPALQSLTFGQGIGQANTVYISNTGLTDLRGIELEGVEAMDVNNNQYLKTINVNALTNVTQALSFSANGRNLEIEFPNLESAANLTFRNVTSISMPSLATVAGAMGFYSNGFTSFTAPNLTETGGTIAFVDSPELSNLSFPSLERIRGGLQLANNTKLLEINGFNSVSTIDGDINFYGTFENVSFTALTDVKGAANIYTSSSNTKICDLFNQAHSQQAIKGNVKCATSSNNIANNGSTATGSGSGSSTSSGAATSNLLNYNPSAPLTGFAAFIAAVLFI